MIPRILHQTWKSKPLSTNPSASSPFPSRLEKYCDSWKRFNPNIEYRFYDDADCLAFVHAEFPELADLYERLPLPILRADLFRYLVVYRTGGIYADVDMECFKSFDQFFSFDDAVFSVEFELDSNAQRDCNFRHPYQIANCIFASEAGHPFLRAVIDKAVVLINSQENISTETVVGATGPHMLTRVFYSQSWPGVNVLKRTCWLPNTFYPDWLYPLHPEIFARHHFLGSWKDGQPLNIRGDTASSRLQRRLFDLIKQAVGPVSGIFGALIVAARNIATCRTKTSRQNRLFHKFGH